MTTDSPAHYHTVKINDEDREIFMSFGLLQTLAKSIGHVTNIQVIPDILLDHDKFEAALRETLAVRNDAGKVEKYLEIEDVKADPNDLNLLMKWVVDHLIDFFIARMKTFADLQTSLAAHKEKMTTS